ncbi:MAG: hypothetical protein A3B37_01140 [Candidatus Sungbacteria bacterium RIFCSPLOWO2_01_FULL_59_16]|uniref:Uncharacterized protein n=1 Tax=Candidatus Sungbacteria bacterium RIFCSPLOWO2_01_FULL_59_16 TaxID=1802280 RepID=A0A1G2LC06_9BACT|nr:MAG: hypothetical protein A3B37_01140 [Candidatus Sungbacteria bacterium RIFCSPLOWO2_01_FULL_59_16]
MPVQRLPRSVRKFLRRKKAEFRRQVSPSADAEAKIRELVAAMRQQYNRGAVRGNPAPNAATREAA